MKHGLLRLIILFLQGVLLGALPLHAQPDTLWTSRLSGAGGYHMETIRTMDGGFAICGGSQYIEGRRDRDFVLTKTDLLGQMEWNAFYEGMPDSVHRNDEAYCLRQYPDGGFVLGGHAGGFYGMVVRTDSTGEQLWTTYLSNREGLPEIYAGVLDAEGNFVAVGLDMALKFNGDGEILWQNHYGGDGGEDLYHIINTTDGGFIIVGRTTSFGQGQADMYAVKIESDGELEWERAYGTGDYDVCSGIVQTGDGGYCLAGCSRFGVGDSVSAMMVRIDPEGEEIWQCIYSEYPSGDFLRDVVQTTDGGFAAAGFGDNGETDYYFLRTDAEGEPLWRTYYEGDDIDRCNSLLIMEDGGYLLGGYSTGAWLVRTEPDPVNAVWEVDPSLPGFFTLHSPYPNPFNSKTNIRYQLPAPGHVVLTILDIKGRELEKLVDGRIEAGYHRTVWDASGSPSGIYFYRLEAGSFASTRKLMLIK